MSGDLQTEIPPVAPMTDDTRTRATAYLTRTDNTDLLEVLGLVENPETAARNKARAMASVHGHGHKKLINCTTCKRNMWLAWNGVCKRSDCAEVGARKRAGGPS